MRFKRRVLLETGFKPMDIVPMIDVLFLLVLFFALSSSFAVSSGVHVKLPKAVTSDMITQQQMTVTISDDNVLYFNGMVVSVDELSQHMETLKIRQIPLLIRADRRASVGRVVDVWDLGRRVGLEKINIAASQRN